MEIYRKSIEGRTEIKEISQIKRLFEYYSNKMDNYIITDVSLRYNMKLYLSSYRIGNKTEELKNWLKKKLFIKL